MTRFIQDLKSQSHVYIIFFDLLLLFRLRHAYSLNTFLATVFFMSVRQSNQEWTK